MSNGSERVTVVVGPSAPSRCSRPHVAHLTENGLPASRMSPHAWNRPSLQEALGDTRSHFGDMVSASMTAATAATTNSTNGDIACMRVFGSE
ncbi:MAG: hypothetical protein QOF66_3893 [Mycobacterium sp.]|jgi:hypothetical protein|nr:hypothetical protein [Mycobacterium sp.]